MADPLAPFFLGSYGENNDFFEKTVVELFRDHVYWRRNFHPEDTPPISTVDQYDRDYLEGLARTRHELHDLTAQLKRSVPFFHPRYLGHMVSDLLMPGLVAQLVTTLYNPNNIVEEAAPITVALELEVGRQLCRMVGYQTDASREPCALGHLTSGGTVANDEALWLARATKLYPLAVKAACHETGIEVKRWLHDADEWALLNQPVSRVLELARAVAMSPKVDVLQPAIVRHRVESMGLARFCAAHPLVANLSVVAPATAHYSWKKAMSLLGLGVEQLIEVATTEARIDIAALDVLLARQAALRRPVLAVVGVFGTTEFGTFDPIHEIAKQRGRHLEFWLHVDAAWGGYMPSLFRDASGALRPRDEVKKEFRYFPSERVYRSTEALAHCDSITVDPHKMGFVPFGAGALVVRDRTVLDLVQQEAAYVFTAKSGAQSDDARYRSLGRFTLEGSKPGAAAAACYVNHRVLPLDSEHFGRLMARTIHHAEALFDLLGQLAQSLRDDVRLVMPFEPDSNLICLAINPVGNRSLLAANAFGRRLFEAFKVGGDERDHFHAFFGSCTTVALTHLGSEQRRLFESLGLDTGAPDDEGLFLLRHTLMNPWLQASPKAGVPSYLEAYCQHLTQLIHRVLGR